MYISGTNFRLSPEVSNMRLTYDNLMLLGTGVAEVGVSGSGNRLAFLFSGNKITSPNQRFIGTYNTGESFNLEWVIDNSNYYYLLNNKIIKKINPKNNFSIQRFFINTTGAEISSDIKIYGPEIPYSLSFDENFYALSSLTGRITNDSNYKFKIFDSSLTFYNSVASPLSGVISGDVSGNSGLTFSFSDTNTSRFDSDVRFLAKFNTSIGIISGLQTSSRVSGLDLIVSNISTDEDGVNLNVLFDGSGVSGNKFLYVPTAASHLFSYYCSSTNLKGESKPKQVTVSFEPISPLNSSTYQSVYVTGFSLISGGEYLYPPIFKSTGYYFVTGLNWSLNTILMSSGCSGNLPVLFSGANNRGRNASGIFKMSKTLFTGMFGEGLNYYYLPQSFEMVSGGTGYLSEPRALLQTGIFNNCYDVAAKYNGTYSLYRPFSGSGIVSSLADFLTGEVLTTPTGVSGNSVSGYTITGFEFTNIGSGYSSEMFPHFSFYRLSGDNLTANASGNLLMKSTGHYLTTGNWTIETGKTTFDLITMSGLTGTGQLTNLDNTFTIQVNYSGRDYTQPIIVKMIVGMSGASSLTHYITGTQRYDISTGFLKKKNNLALTTFNTESELSFTLTESELDEYYSSSEYINTGASIEIGDLDF